ncbi:50S ribosomal protein L14 [bioreactor metagenome]|jgi:large subunit ribosomal protein L14|uniref:50S ribosomal protein L14 n=1 Tax=bioreactor metagenome TaxID=1076179 RepID=A0A645EUT2_9ZZZZ|nr:50S ribosomal protein L14 [Methanomassiliicoccales archaeon RumEn M2]MDD2532741.1 50S ribosomal protein L14 [Candidatus Methanomethylophilaceae archaeon]MDI9378426.1 50S ribosomal protein L14 [Candidatus Thermoplasmatota archaeon]MDD2779293.1 50S ribosomal protein L14 [Candidatus Methanomethylophilaceae archaeon]MDD4119888.1 50S ribosomal protein L14 [Candidatus Methanomethylophilaceae archaeon]
MKGIAGRQTRGLQNGSRLDVVDNSGAKQIEIITVPKYHGVANRVPSAGVGDLVIASVKKGTPQMRRQIVFAVIVRQRRPMRRADGTMIFFEDNAAVITTDNGETKGTDIKGPVAREAAERWPRVSATANMIV